jgi:putative Ca2+/H+ antiporter (TMEM165/GDT1 family)
MLPAAPSLPQLFATVFLGVLFAELAGDKTLYTMGALASRHSVAGLLAGGAVAVAAKMLAGVTLGSFIARLPVWLVSTCGAATFLVMAVSFLRRRSASDPKQQRDEKHKPHRSGFLAALLTLLLTEWGDPGQLAVAVFAARLDHGALIWAAASSAMFAKLLLSVTAGIGVRRWVPARLTRPLAAGAFVVMAFLAALHVEV